VTKKQFLEDLFSDDSFVRFIKGKAPYNEKKYWESWEKKSPHNHQMIEQARELTQYAGFEAGNVPDPQMELKKFEAAAEQTVSGNQKKSIQKFYPPHRRPGTFIRAAAALLIVGILSIGLFLMDTERPEELSEKDVAVQSMSEFQTSYGEKATLQLTNGSEIILNANSRLSYLYTGSAGEGRMMDIYLEGEAWFDIVPDAGENPGQYRIHTSHGVVEVLGTTFAVRTSSRKTQAVLEEGVIRINLNEVEGSKFEEGIVMNPGQMIEFLQDSGRIELREVNPDLYTSWIRDVWIFDETPLAEIAERMESVFGVTVEIASSGLKEKTLSGSIGSKNLSLIKQGISEALDEKVVQNGDTIIIGE
jgi:transmembrane sensor